MVRPSTSGSALSPGAMLGRYELLGLLSVGGMAEIYLARTAGLAGFEKLLVVKRMLPHLAQQRHYIDMFLAEARLGAMLDHPNVVAVNDIGEDTGNYYYAMEYVRGPDLRRIMKAAVQDFGRLPISNAVAIGIGLCAGLDHAHGLTDHQGHPLGVVHRDVSLSNVLVSYDGTVKVTDFGVAKSASSDSRTKAGTLKGKIGYMSPEQCRGDVVDRRSDLFAAGIILYELTTGRRLFRPRQSEFEVLQRIVREDAEPPSVQEPDYPLPLEEIVMRALHRDREQRYQTAREMQRDLETLGQTSRLATTAFALGEYVRALVPPPPLALEALAPRPATRAPTRVPTPPPPEDPWEVDDDPPPLTDTPVAAMTSGTATPSRARPWGKTGLAAIAMVLIGVGAAVVTRGREPAPDERERSEPLAPRRVARAAAVEPPVRASVSEPADPVPAPVPDPDPDPVPAPVPAPAPAPAPAPRRAADRDRDRDRHRRPSTPSRTGPAATSVDAGPSLFDDPLPPPVPAPTLVPDDPPAPAADPPKPKSKPKPKAEDPVPAKPKVVVTKADPGSFDAQASLASVEVDGPLGDSEIRRAVKRVLPAFRACYQAAAKDAGKTPSARAKLRFSIDETRAAQDVRASGSSLPGLNACLESAAARIKTRIAPDVGDAHVTVSVAFSPAEP